MNVQIICWKGRFIMRSMYRVVAIIMTVCALTLSVSAYPSECPGNHPTGYTGVNAFCAEDDWDRAGSCALSHYVPCEVTVTNAHTVYECSVHGNEYQPGDEHVERIVHIDGRGDTKVDECFCPYCDHSNCY